MSLIFKRGEVPSNFRKTLHKPHYKKKDKSECGNYRGIRSTSLGSKLLGIMILIRLRYAVDKVLRQDKCAFRRGRGYVEQIF